ncbi:hypothetical protein EB796_020560 [Bugula neritina]|uniref:Fukutin-related protein n=1 Tax=Bugula neritina TaxID=10212 RepID=A0A7J7J6H9_BUGNE|nr:hypothetical protein EB796_020560 [Bugula neritina]
MWYCTIMAIGVRIINKFSISDYAIKRFAFLIYFLLNERAVKAEINMRMFKHRYALIWAITIILWIATVTLQHYRERQGCSANNFIDSTSARLVKIATKVGISKKLWAQEQPNFLLDEVYEELKDILGIMGQQPELDRAEKALESPKSHMSTDVCPEKYIEKKIAKDDPKYIFYRRIGFYQENCTDVPEFHTLLTLVYNFVHYDSKYFQHIPSIFHDVNKLYPNIRIIAAIPDTLTLNQADYKDTTIIKLKKRQVHKILSKFIKAESSIWRNLTDRVQTKYVYIGRNVIKFTWFDRLERLVREIGNLEASVVSGAYRTLVSGVWSNGCDQSVLYNYQLVYRAGYMKSRQECLMCHHVRGPFVAKASLFKKIPLKADMSATSSFAVWFLKLKKLSLLAASCPDVMSFVTDEASQPTEKEQWLGVASALQVERIRLPNKKLLKFGCKEAKTFCDAKDVVGRSMSFCCKDELTNGISFIMEKCRNEGMVCQLNAGTNLGAVKFADIVPWDNDADILIHPDNVTAFNTLDQYFIDHGYSLNQLAKGYKRLSTRHWTIEVFADPLQTPAAYNVTPTFVQLHGIYLEATISPGLFARNMYGVEIYQHVQHSSQNKQHLQTNNIWSYYSYATKRFTKCPIPGHHSCLDRFLPDGNFLFKEPVI